MKNYVLETIEKTIKENELINKGDHVVLGLSGGPDSLCLFSVLMELRDKAGFTLSTVHVNHGFRPGAAEEDQVFVEKLCEDAGIECMSVNIDCNAMADKLGLTSEEAGRLARYDAFDEAAEAHGGIVKIAVAQNLDDQCETMMFRLMRGTGPDGLAAIQYSRKSEKGFDIIRPLLDVDRKHIEEYCSSMDLSPRIDHTNAENAYTRNRIRNELIPYIEDSFNPEFKSALIRLSRSLNDDRRHFENETLKAMADVSADGVIDIEKYSSYDRSLRHRMLMGAMDSAGLTDDVSMVHVDAVDGLALKNETGKIIELPKGYIAEVSYGNLRIWNGEREEEAGEKKKVTALFSKDELMKEFGTCSYEIRKRAPGDYIHLASGRKKLKDLFIDMKIPRDERDELFVVAIGSEILWVPGIRYSSRYRAEKDDEKAIKVELFVNI